VLRDLASVQFIVENNTARVEQRFVRSRQSSREFLSYPRMTQNDVINIKEFQQRHEREFLISLIKNASYEKDQKSHCVAAEIFREGDNCAVMSNATQT